MTARASDGEGQVMSDMRHAALVIGAGAKWLAPPLK